MSEEEKKAIETLKEIKDVRGIRQDVEGEGEDLCALDIVYNLIEKQQKEIDFLQTKIKQNENIEKVKMCMTHNLPNNAEIVCMIREDFERNFGNDFISKDKIRAKIEDLKSLSKNITMQPSIYNYEIDLLKELLEENTNE